MHCFSQAFALYPTIFALFPHDLRRHGESNAKIQIEQTTALFAQTGADGCSDSLDQWETHILNLVTNRNAMQYSSPKTLIFKLNVEA